MKTRISMILVLAMLVSALAGCGKQETKEKEPTVITVGSTRVWQDTPVMWYETEVWKAIQEKANVKIEYIQYDKELFNLMLTSGDVPDLMYSEISDKIDDVVKSGLALDMTPYLEEYAPNMLSGDYAQRNDLVSLFKGGEEKALYFIAPRIGVENLNGGVDSSRGYNIRWDYYEEMGAPEIKNDDDYIALLEKMQALHPTNEKGEKVYAVGNYDNPGLSNWYQRAAVLKNVRGNMFFLSPSQYMTDNVTGELFNGYTDTERGAFWVDMAFYNKLYNKGLMDPESFTQTNQEYTTKIKAGRYLASMPTRNNGLYDEMKKVDPETTAGLIRIPSENAVAFANKKNLLGDFPTAYTFVSAKTKNVEAVMRLLNVLHDEDTIRMFYSGMEGVHWNYVNGVPTYTDEMKELLKNQGGDEFKKLGVMHQNVAYSLIPVTDTFIHSDGYPVSLSESDSVRAETLSGLQQAMADYYEVSYPSQATMKLVEAGKAIDLSNDFGQLVRAAMPATTTDVNRGIEKINDVLYRAIPKLVKAKNQAEFDAVQAQVLKDLKDAGEPEVWNWVKTEHAKAFAKVQPIFEKCEW